jgi:hypothetical protein
MSNPIPTRPYSPRKVREAEPTTLSQFARSQANEPRGRFTHTEKPVVIGATPTPEYPAIPMHVPTGTEPPLGQDINEGAVVGEFHEIQKSLSAAASSPAAVQGAGAVRSVVGSPSNDVIETVPAAPPTKPTRRPMQ